MIIEKGVSMIMLHRNIKRILPIVDTVFTDSGNYLIIISTLWPNDHRKMSHICGVAIDIKWPLNKSWEVVKRVQAALGLNYTVRGYLSHLHIEFSPVKTLPQRGGAPWKKN